MGNKTPTLLLWFTFRKTENRKIAVAILHAYFLGGRYGGLATR
jgi:hypothetical protein